MTTPQLWPIFICYRRVDGSAAARRLYEILDRWKTADHEGQPIQIDAYLDETMPAIADWKAVHRPYLEKARALIVVCTPGAKLVEGPDDWVHQEVNWWIAHRETAPILVDPLLEGVRYVPEKIARRWPDIQRIPLLEEEWKRLSGVDLEQKTEAVRRQIIGAILPSGAAIYTQEIAVERQRARRLTAALVVAIAFLAVALIVGGIAWDRQQAARRNQRIVEASLLDVRADGLFDEFHALETRRELEMSRRADILARLASAEPGAREGNLRHELRQLDADVAGLNASSKQALTNGRELLQQADGAWNALAANGVLSMERKRPEPPHIFSVELINAGAGESILLHYGTPDDVKLLMINAGPRRMYRSVVEPRLRQLSVARFGGGPVPIELFVIGDRDEEKTGGLEVLLSDLTQPASGTAVVRLRGIWANIFRTDGTRLRLRIRQLIDELRIPVNQPFDRHVVRPHQGRAVVAMAGGLQIIVLGPTEKHVAALRRSPRADASDETVESLHPEEFRKVSIESKPAPLTVGSTAAAGKAACIASENARQLAGGSYSDQSISNLASTILLLRFRGRTFLYTGDARGDLILEGLSRAGLLDASGQATVDLMTIPHLGSDRNITIDFFRQVRAEGYLFSGDGTHGNPEIATVAALIAARGCDSYRMYFVNREGPRPLARTELTTGDESHAATERGPVDTNVEDVHGAKLDTFFKEEQRFNPNYRRIFRSVSGGSVIIDLLNPVRY